jgi:hypothetical protein
MTNTSATGGYLLPTYIPDIEDLAFDEVLQSIVVGVTGMPGALVRPRWQPVPLPQPEADVDWVAVGITDETEEGSSIEHKPYGEGYDLETTHNLIEVTVSFYGPNSRRTANTFRDGIRVAQNREIMQQNDLGFVDVVRLVAVPELINEVWRQRSDVTFRLRRATVRTYAVENLVKGDGTITPESGEAETWETP